MSHPVRRLGPVTRPPRPRLAALAALVVLLSSCALLPGAQRSTAPTPPASAPGTSASPSGQGSPQSIDPSAPVVTRAPGTAPDRDPVELTNTKPKGFVAALKGSGLAPYNKQKLAWKPCSNGKGQCATVVAPLDYAKPQQQGITLALKRIPATKKPRLGSLFVNPGGPGAGGRGLAESFDRKGLEQYDIVGWDPRGTGGSTPVRCGSPAQTDAYLELDASPDDDAEQKALIDGARAFGLQCAKTSGTLLAHISTADTVRDLDLLRQLVGDDKLTYLGYSYGTQIGAYYADMFPATTGKLVLDSAVDIVDDASIIQAMGFDLAFDHFAQWCTKNKRTCGFGDTTDEVVSRTKALLMKLDKDPLKVGKRELNQSLAVTGVVATLYSRDTWEFLGGALRLAEQGDGQYLLLAADYQNDRKDDGTFGTLAYAFPAIGCLDYADYGVQGGFDEWKTDQAKAPLFGYFFGPNVTCARWPVAPAEQIRPTGKGAGPVLVIGATGDSATPYKQAVTMASTLESASLLTYDGEGHATYGGKSSCVDKAVVTFFTKGTRPDDGTVCR